LGDRLDIVDGKTTASLSREDQILFVGGEGELGDADRQWQLGLRGKGANFAVAGRVGSESLADGLGSRKVNGIGASGSD
jgi:hypothetical protein